MAVLEDLEGFNDRLSRTATTSQSWRDLLSRLIGSTPLTSPTETPTS